MKRLTSPITIYELNRPLEDFEREHQLQQKVRSPCPPWFQISVIKMNSTFLECPDKWFAEKGFIAGPGLILVGMFTALGLFILFTLPVKLLDPLADGRLGTFFTGLFGCVVSGFIAWGTSYFLKKEMFRYTHYPMRFNRKTRKVHCFRDDGTVMTEDWDKLFFYVTPAQWGSWEVRFHRLSEDRNTVLETFALQFMADKHEPFLLSQWEFVRHYMEEGPEELAGQVVVVQDVAERRETFWNGFQRTMAGVAKLPALMVIIYLPVGLFYSIGRWIAMRTCSVPVWPAEIEAECQIAPDDPYIRDRNNLAPYNSMVLPEGATSAQCKGASRRF